MARCLENSVPIVEDRRKSQINIYNCLVMYVKKIRNLDLEAEEF